ncbi:MAG TPA: hypothetical protein PL110_00525 [Candidatus Eremiobacteraeota bacterium]|nr:MAG: hypothetical protein BWY64_00128 [bacterium ADurb.Bin363]HPZ06571.1 hypothetical protein [Candidatus Eremiobacteraeota bacterium]
MKNLFYLILFLLYTIIPGWSANTEGNKALTFGKQQFNTGNYEKAKEFFASALNQDPNLVEAYEYRAKSASKIGKNSLDADISFYKSRLITMKEKNFSVHFGLACTYLEKMSFDSTSKQQAAKELLEVITKDPSGSFGTRAVELQKQYNIKTSKPEFSIIKIFKYYNSIIFYLIAGLIVFSIILLIFRALYPRNRLKSTFAAIIVAVLIYILATMTTLTGFGLRTSYGKSIRTGGSYTGGMGIHPGK